MPGHVDYDDEDGDYDNGDEGEDKDLGLLPGHVEFCDDGDYDDEDGDYNIGDEGEDKNMEKDHADVYLMLDPCISSF